MVKKINQNKNRTKCDVWARVVGFLRPVKDFNEGKKAEFNDRAEFDISEAKDGR